jgi:phosphate transport system permease protein
VAAISPQRRSVRIVHRRRNWNAALWIACGLALALVVAPVASILIGVAAHALSHWHWSALTTPTQGAGGGLANAIAGTFVIILGVAVVSGTLGVAGGVYLAEFATGRTASFLRGASEVLSGVPSILMGYVGFTALVVGLGWGFGLGAGLVVLSIMVMPYIVKSTEVALRQVPTAYREGAEALGLPAGWTLRRLVIRPALPGIATGLIVAIAIALGETAPLLYTAGWSDGFPTAHLTHAPVGYLPYVVYTFYQQPYNSAHILSNLAALLLIVMLVFLIVLARVLVAATQKYAPDQPRSGRR